MSADRYQQSMSESQMLKAIRDYVLLEQGFCWHVRMAKDQDLLGLPDVIAILPPKHGSGSGSRPGTIAFFELKTQSDRVSPVQHKVIRMIGQASEIAYGIVRPKPRSLAEITLDDALALLGKEDS